MSRSTRWFFAGAVVLGPVAAWTNCDVSLPNDSHYLMERMAAGDSDHISMMRFKSNGPEREVPPTWLNVKCTEGAVRMTMTVKE